MSPRLDFAPQVQGPGHTALSQLSGGRQIGVPIRFPQQLGQTLEQEEKDGIELNKLPMSELAYQENQDTYPIAIVLEKDDVVESKLASQTTFAQIVPEGDGQWKIKAIKQKIQIGDAAYELQEIYGIELHEKASSSSNAEVEESSECVICMTEPRDTTVLPCRHMCLCSGCAKVLRFQANKCPVCREAVASFLHIKVQNEDA